MKRDLDETDIVDYNDSEDSDADEHSRKVPRLSSFVANTSENTASSKISRGERLPSDEVSLTRNKRLFSGLLSHLGWLRQ